eukprot:TRINITY_DN7258_c0_g1_i1.p1 TRINITY_DN7258_c0_g1~~TRINITY_DN7258_c0_g1_i1.p1  ORF type:complete len:125 (+),score=51.37 TRINITY_DN7258_c0_g1_i1:147-521(+)
MHKIHDLIDHHHQHKLERQEEKLLREEEQRRIKAEEERITQIQRLEEQQKINEEKMQKSKEKQGEPLKLAGKSVDQVKRMLDEEIGVEELERRESLEARGIPTDQLPAPAPHEGTVASNSKYNE